MGSNHGDQRSGQGGKSGIKPGAKTEKQVGSQGHNRRHRRTSTRVYKDHIAQVKVQPRKEAFLAFLVLASVGRASSEPFTYVVILAGCYIGQLLALDQPAPDPCISGIGKELQGVAIVPGNKL